MKRPALAVTLCAVMVVVAFSAWARETAHTKVHPHSVRYPLICPVPFDSKSGDPYERAFGMNRLLKGFSAADIASAIIETDSWFRVYGSYGVIGRGEDVFTAGAARFRQQQRENAK